VISDDRMSPGFLMSMAVNSHEVLDVPIEM
jgi:hypothetical protein